jgi:hypothetical protein
MFEQIVRQLNDIGIDVYAIFDPDEFGQETPWKMFMTADGMKEDDPLQVVSKMSTSHEQMLIDLKIAADALINSHLAANPTQYSA